MQQSRRTNPYPLTWEIPCAVTLAVLLLLVLGVHAGRTVANMLAGAGITWPASDKLITSLPGVLGGDAAAGLTPQPDLVAAPRATQVWIALTEAISLALMLWAGTISLLRWGPGRMRGMATRAEVQNLLGRRRLRRSASVIRPDLYGKNRA